MVSSRTSPSLTPGTHHDLPVHLDAAVEQGSKPTQAGGATAVAQQAGADVGIGGVDGDEQRAQPLGEDPLEVHLGEAGQGGEVPVEEGQAEVVVLEREASAHARRKLVDETEGAMVVAGPHPVEDGRGHLDPERLSCLLVDRDGEGPDRRPPNDQLERAVVGGQVVLDDIAG